MFVLLGPDAVARQLGVPILDRLEAAGFTAVRWQLICRRPSDLDTFHAVNIDKHWKGYLYRLVDRLFAYGPFMALDVAGSHEELRALKGSSDPAQAAPGTIRGDLGTINVVLALMHSSDTPADSERESAVFVPDGFAGEGDPRPVLKTLARGGVAETRGFDEVLVGLRSRIEAALWHEEPGHPVEAVLRHDFLTPGLDVEHAADLAATVGVRIDPWERLVLATSQHFAPRRGGADGQGLGQ
ncbi:nucleoside-diphosphate kinase [Lentzea guizhouensis]|uniref:nucleoside-diphosphate kinase n=1 Tax=Lentzea guizhouensis TaxID=1586287 RepID=UPI0014759D4B|nr:nucleoside-diphosphate kinase [Lentzea guizhouensis]